jgi:chemotaxis protein CheY-P-specific phosphatase CheC
VKRLNFNNGRRTFQKKLGRTVKPANKDRSESLIPVADKPWEKTTDREDECMREDIFTEEESDALQEIANLAMGQAATRLAHLLDSADS